MGFAKTSIPGLQQTSAQNQAKIRGAMGGGSLGSTVGGSVANTAGNMMAGPVTTPANGPSRTTTPGAGNNAMFGTGAPGAIPGIGGAATGTQPVTPGVVDQQMNAGQLSNNVVPGVGGMVDLRTENQPGGGGGNSNLQDLNALYDDLLAKHDANWGETQKLMQNQLGAYSRQADALNARMGRSIAGGYAGLQGSALARGMNEMSEAKLGSDKARDTLLMDKLEKTIGEKNRREDIDLAKQDKADQKEIDTLELLIQANGGNLPPEAIQSIVSGDTSGAVKDLGGVVDTRRTELSRKKDQKAASLKRHFISLGMSAAQAEQMAKTAADEWFRSQTALGA